ncbi:hypothetical protein LINPERPRIM_LOCUS7286 [Linum perenne]
MKQQQQQQMKKEHYWCSSCCRVCATFEEAGLFGGNFISCSECGKVLSHRESTNFQVREKFDKDETKKISSKI